MQSRRPRVYFEEWDDPLISGIRWVEELVEVAGGDSDLPRAAAQETGEGPHRRIGRSRSTQSRNHRRVVVRQAGATRRRSLDAQDGSEVAAVRDGQIHEIKSAYILQPGPAALTEGVRQLREIICRADL